MLGRKKVEQHQTRAGNVDTWIGQGAELQGDLTFSGGLHVDGRVCGTVRGSGADAVVTLTEHGCIEGEVHAPFVVINGRLQGDIHASEKVELAAGARVQGNIYYKLIEMAAGAEIDGKLVRQSSAPKQLTGPGSAESPASTES